MTQLSTKILWLFVATLGAICFGYLALQNGESVSAIYLVVAAVCIYMIGYRFYGRFVAYKVLELDKNRATPALVENDGRDFVPTNKAVLFGHHFAAIAGAGPLVGPILAAQMGYLPSMLWILVGGVLAGAVHDFVVLFISTRRKGRSLGEMIKDEMGKIYRWSCYGGDFWHYAYYYCHFSYGGCKSFSRISMGFIYYRNDYSYSNIYGHLYAFYPSR